MSCLYIFRICVKRSVNLFIACFFMSYYKSAILLLVLVGAHFGSSLTSDLLNSRSAQTACHCSGPVWSFKCVFNMKQILAVLSQD